MQTAGKGAGPPGTAGGGKGTGSPGPPGGKGTLGDRIKDAAKNLGKRLERNEDGSLQQGSPPPPNGPRNMGTVPIRNLPNMGMAYTGVNNVMLGEKKESGGIFDKVYLIIVAIGLIAVFALLVVCFMNFIKLLVIHKKQKKEAKNKLIRDTIEYKFLTYANEKVQTEGKSNKKFLKNIFSTKKIKTSIEHDPLFINVQITITTILYQIVAIFIIALIINTLMSLLPVLKMIRESGQTLNMFIIQKMKEEVSNTDKRYYLGLGGILFIAVLSSLLLQFVFKVSVNKVIFNIKKKAYQLKQKIGENVYVDKTFIDMLYNDNFEAIKHIIGQSINGNVQLTSKMIFTYNVYKHYISNFTLSSPNMQEFKEAFTYENLKEGTFEPIEFLMYSDNMDKLLFDDYFMDGIKSDLEATNNTVDKDLMQAYTRNKIGEITIQDEVLNKIKMVNDITKNFRKTILDDSYEEIFKFTLIMFLIAILIIVLLIAFARVFEKPKEIMDNFVSALAKLADAIGNWFKLMIAGIV